MEQVFYPGLESHQNHDIARRQMRGFGGALSFILKGNNFDVMKAFLPRLCYAHAAANLGAVETVVGPPDAPVADAAERRVPYRNRHAA